MKTMGKLRVDDFISGYDLEKHKKNGNIIVGENYAISSFVESIRLPFSGTLQTDKAAEVAELPVKERLRPYPPSIPIEVKSAVEFAASNSLVVDQKSEVIFVRVSGLPQENQMTEKLSRNDQKPLTLDQIVEARGRKDHPMTAELEELSNTKSGLAQLLSRIGLKH